MEWPIRPINNFHKSFGVKIYQVIVEEKRKRMDDVGPYQRPETREQKRREIEKDVAQPKSKQKALTSTYKLALDIETNVDIRKILETRILGSKIELPLKELLGIMEKEFHEVIIYVIKWKSQVEDKVKGFNVVKHYNRMGH